MRKEDGGGKGGQRDNQGPQSMQSLEVMVRAADLILSIMRSHCGVPQRGPA